MGGVDWVGDKEVYSAYSISASSSGAPFNDFGTIDAVTIASNGTAHNVEFQGHHVIPRTVFNNSAFLDALKGGFDPNSFAINGVALPAKIDGGKASESDFRPIVGGALHNGGHAAYTEAVSEIISEFDEKYSRSVKTGDWGEFPDEPAWLRAQSKKSMAW